MYVGTAATVASAAYGAYNSYKSSKDAKKAGQQSGANLANPSGNYLGSLFGQTWDPKKGWTGSGGGIFGGTETGYLKDLMTPNPLYSGAQSAATQGMDMGAAGMAPAVAGIGEGMSWLKGLADSGPTSIDPIIAQRKYDLMHNVVPQLAEQYSGLGSSGTMSSDFGGSLARAGGQMEADLGAKQYDAIEAYKTRLQQAAPMYGTMAGTQAALPVSLGSDILGLGGNLRTQQQSALPGNQVLALYQALQQSGTPNNMGFYQTGYAPTSNAAGTMSALGQAIPGIIGALGSAYGGSGTMSAGTGVGGGQLGSQGYDISAGMFNR